MLTPHSSRKAGTPGVSPQFSRADSGRQLGEDHTPAASPSNLRSPAASRGLGAARRATALLSPGVSGQCGQCSANKEAFKKEKKKFFQESEHLRNGVNKALDVLSTYLKGNAFSEFKESLQLDVRFATQHNEDDDDHFIIKEDDEMNKFGMNGNSTDENPEMMKLSKRIQRLEEEMAALEKENAQLQEEIEKLKNKGSSKSDSHKQMLNRMVQTDAPMALPSDHTCILGAGVLKDIQMRVSSPGMNNQPIERSKIGQSMMKGHGRSRGDSGSFGSVEDYAHQLGHQGESTGSNIDTRSKDGKHNSKGSPRLGKRQAIKLFGGSAETDHEPDDEGENEQAVNQMNKSQRQSQAQMMMRMSKSIGLDGPQRPPGAAGSLWSNALSKIKEQKRQEDKEKLEKALQERDEAVERAKNSEREGKAMKKKVTELNEDLIGKTKLVGRHENKIKVLEAKIKRLEAKGPQSTNSKKEARRLRGDSASQSEADEDEEYLDVDQNYRPLPIGAPGCVNMRRIENAPLLKDAKSSRSKVFEKHTQSVPSLSSIGFKKHIEKTEISWSEPWLQTMWKKPQPQHVTTLPFGVKWNTGLLLEEQARTLQGVLDDQKKLASTLDGWRDRAPGDDVKLPSLTTSFRGADSDRRRPSALALDDK
eukprot:gnl/MRDRNA2_/MRDRNA2_62881_c0_seq1.p1 gnl/MRDRNA2_/MRDRNA2_62881_c0~~gnl/MRDRNA2_/MRDRNA2_62881_c0_seq1.p1  ORF type:complete len:647 (-),score=159.30 gnl/MRDRNA2_/MRDRNA2_62881_c0_seq1:64-2004(-)